MAASAKMSEVQADIAKFQGNKAKLMQHYSDRQALILKDFGGSLSDIPVDEEHEYHKIQAKMNLLHNISLSEIERKEPEPPKVRK